jgi:hypothetical protein
MKKPSMYLLLCSIVYLILSSGCSVSYTEPKVITPTSPTPQKPPPSAHMIFETQTPNLKTQPTNIQHPTPNIKPTLNPPPSTLHPQPSTLNPPLSLKKRTKERKTPWIPAPQVENIDISLN